MSAHLLLLINDTMVILRACPCSVFTFFREYTPKFAGAKELHVCKLILKVSGGKKVCLCVCVCYVCGERESDSSKIGKMLIFRGSR